MIDNKLVQEITKLVAENLNQLQRKILLVYTGTDNGSGYALEALKALKTRGFSFDVLISRKAYELDSSETACRILEPDIILLEGASELPDDLVSGYDMILVPALTVESASRIASCMAECAAEAVIFEGLMRGKKVVIALDGCCPDMISASDPSYQMAGPLREKLKEHLRTLQSYGARMISAKHMEKEALALTEANPGTTESGSSCLTSKEVAQSEIDPHVTASSRLISVRDIAALPENGVIHVRAGTMVTQAAEEEAHRRSVEIQYDW